MKLLHSLLCISCLFTYCTGSSADQHANSAGDDTTTMHIQVPGQSCYFYSNGKDTFQLKVEKFPNVVTGELTYDFFEKDQSTGTIDGILRGDTLIADYTFTSEGEVSTRQVIFLLNDTVAMEGYRETEIVDQKQTFENTGQVDFTKGTRLHAVPCKMLERHH